MPNESQPTPGPWKKGSTHCNPNAKCFKTTIYSVTEDAVAETVTFWSGGRFVTKRNAEEARLNSMANARLIAAAPALLEALEKLLFAVENADETGYVTDHGFIDLDAINEAARAAIQSTQQR